MTLVKVVAYLLSLLPLGPCCTLTALDDTYIHGAFCFFEGWCDVCGYSIFCRVHQYGGGGGGGRGGEGQANMIRCSRMGLGFQRGGNTPLLCEVRGLSSLACRVHHLRILCTFCWRAATEGWGGRWGGGVLLCEEYYDERRSRGEGCGSWSMTR